MISLLLLLPLFSTLAPVPVTSEVVLDSGYFVSTVLDFNKHSPAAIHPFALLPRHRSNGLLLLDSSTSNFYSLPIPVSQDAEVLLFSGKGDAGFADGDPMAAMFSHPRSFAIDSMDNVYVADRTNHAIRKISSAGRTTTIAGGYSEKTGHVDGPAQNASFSNDFDLVYVPKICALLISDRGNRLIRQLDLKPEDCAHKSQLGLGVAPVAIGGILCVLLGLILGFVARSFFTSHGVSSNRCINKTWRHYQANLGKVALMICSGIRNVVAKSMVCMLILRLVNLSLSYLSVVLNNVGPARQSKNVGPPRQVHCRETVSLLDSDVPSNPVEVKSQILPHHLEDLISLDGLDVLGMNISSDDKQKDEMEYASKGTLCLREEMIIANLSDLCGQAKLNGKTEVSKACSCGMVQRKPRGFDGL